MSFAVLAADQVSGWSPGFEGALVRARARAHHYGEALVLSTERGGPALLVAHLERRQPCQLLLRFPLRLVSSAHAPPAETDADPSLPSRDHERGEGAVQLDLFDWSLP